MLNGFPLDLERSLEHTGAGCVASSPPAQEDPRAVVLVSAAETCLEFASSKDEGRTSVVHCEVQWAVLGSTLHLVKGEEENPSCFF